MHHRILFFTLVVALCIGIALISAKIYGETFRLSHPVRHGIIIDTILTTLFFFGSIVGSRSTKLGISPVVYTMINILAGFGFYLFVGALALGIAASISLLLVGVVPLWLPRLFLSLALLSTFIGILQSRKIAIVRYTVAIPELPLSWEGRRAILVTDTHFGLVNQKKFSRMVTQKIAAQKPDIIIHGGDFYDGPNIALAPVTADWKTLAQQIPIFYAPGNHEMYGDYQSFLASLRDADIRVLENEAIEYDGIRFAGITYYAGKESPDAASVLDALDIARATAPVILINHPPTDIHIASARGVSLMLSGHTHNGQFWPNNLLVRGIYGPYAYGMHTHKDTTIITSSGVGTFGPPMRFLNPPEIVEITFRKG